MLKSNATSRGSRISSNNEIGEKKHCHFHQQKGHSLSECKAFEKETLDNKMEYARRAGLCFCSLGNRQRSSECPVSVKCEKCGDDHHPMALHKEKPVEPRREHGEEVKSACTAVCQNPHRGGVPVVKSYLLTSSLEVSHKDLSECMRSWTIKAMLQ